MQLSKPQMSPCSKFQKNEPAMSVFTKYFTIKLLCNKEPSFFFDHLSARCAVCREKYAKNRLRKRDV